MDMDMPMAGMGLMMLFPLIYLGLLIYLVVLAGRLVKAVERIADDATGRVGP